MENIRYKSDSFRGASTITPSDSANLENPVSAIYVGGTGNLSVVMANGESATFTNVPVGVLEIAVVKVLSTGTTATGLVGLK